MKVKICPKCKAVNDAIFQACKKCLSSLDRAEEKELSSEEIQKLEQALRDSVSEDESLRQRMEQIPMPTILGLIWPFLLMLFGVAFFVIMCISGGFFSIVFGLLLCGFFLLCGIAAFSVNKDNYKLARSDLDAYKRKVIAKQDATAKEKDPETVRKKKQQQIELERLRAENSQRANEPWTVRYATYPCPYCGHYKVRAAKWEDKQVSVAFWGVASSKIGKNYKCEYCGKMW